MITTVTKEIISGTEEELLEYFKNKYNLVNSCCGGKTENTTPKTDYVDPHSNIPNAFQNKPSTQTNKVTNGIGNLFGGTSWGKN
jgi:hypothetical protein